MNDKNSKPTRSDIKCLIKDAERVKHNLIAAIGIYLDPILRDASLLAWEGYGTPYISPANSDDILKTLKERIEISRHFLRELRWQESLELDDGDRQAFNDKEFPAAREDTSLSVNMPLNREPCNIAQNTESDFISKEDIRRIKDGGNKQTSYLRENNPSGEVRLSTEPNLNVKRKDNIEETGADSYAFGIWPTFSSPIQATVSPPTEQNTDDEPLPQQFVINIDDMSTFVLQEQAKEKPPSSQKKRQELYNDWLVSQIAVNKSQTILNQSQVRLNNLKAELIQLSIDEKKLK